MQIPYEVSARRDTGLFNAKLGIWLFLASEVMLFGGLFSAYIFLRLGNNDVWPYGREFQALWAGGLNTAVLIFSSIAVLKAWTHAKLRNWPGAQRWLWITVLCAVAFMGIKAYEYNKKFHHFGAFIHEEAWPKYEGTLKAMKANFLPHKVSRTVEVTGHLENAGIFDEKAFLENQLAYATASNDKATAAKIEKKIDRLKLILVPEPRFMRFGEGHGGHGILTDQPLPPGEFALPLTPGEVKVVEAIENAGHGHGHGADPSQPDAHGHASEGGHGDFKPIEIALKDVWRSGYWFPGYSSYFSIYYTLTGLHALHVVGGALVLGYFAARGGSLYRRNPEHQANRIEVGGLFWHFVDLVWIFLFPILYLL
jgi:cytochrome c oxidase subunit 3